jgi:putative tryptophan/tyrosine transport system substrate-binding protein
VRRRAFITLIGGAVATWPLAARAQLPAVPVIGAPTIGVLNYAAAHDIRVSQFLNALRELGYVEGRNLAIIQRHADGVLDRLPQLAAELVGAKVDLIIALGPAVWAAKQATTTIPIVIAFSGNPERQGVVASLARPGGNLTGFSYMSGDLAGKRLELLCRALTKCSRIAVLYNPQEPATTLELEETEAAAGRLGVSLQPVVARHAEELKQAFAGAKHVDGLLVFTHGFAVLNHAHIMQLASQQALPTMYGWRDFVEEGGLISYGPDIQILVRQAAIYVHRILKGERPSNLPVQQPTRLELIINLKTAKALGLEVPPTLLAITDEVIE